MILLAAEGKGEPGHAAQEVSRQVFSCMRRKAVPITLSDHERGALERTLRTTTAAQREVWRGLVPLVQTKVVARGVFPSKRDLVAKLPAFVDKFNREGKRFHWTKTPDQILQSLERLSRH